MADRPADPHRWAGPGTPAHPHHRSAADGEGSLGERIWTRHVRRLHDDRGGFAPMSPRRSAASAGCRCSPWPWPGPGTGRIRRRSTSSSRARRSPGRWISILGRALRGGRSSHPPPPAAPSRSASGARAAAPPVTARAPSPGPARPAPSGSAAPPAPADAPRSPARARSPLGEDVRPLLGEEQVDLRRPGAPTPSPRRYAPPPRRCRASVARRSPAAPRGRRSPATGHVAALGRDGPATRTASRHPSPAARPGRARRGWPRAGARSPRPPGC